MAAMQQSERTPANGTSRLVNFRLTPAEFEEAEHFARQSYRSRALFFRLMYLRGLQAYQQELDNEG